MRLTTAILILLSLNSLLLARDPNVLFIVVDDLGWKDTSCYGSSFYETPNVDRLAASGMRFTDAYAASPLCSPTRASILTGQYPVRTGFTSASGHVKGKHKHAERTRVAEDIRAAGPASINHLALEYYTLGEAMRDAGYATTLLGKWHMGFAPYIPENHGFEHVVGGRSHPGPPGLAPSRKFYPPWDKIDTLPENPPKDLHIDDYLGTCAVDYIEKNKEKPFFMCLWLYNVHAPFQSNPALVEKWKKKVDPNNPQHSPTMAAMVEMMDNCVGRVLDALEANGISDETIIIFTSDNGGNMYDVADGTTATNNAPLRSGKGNNYEGGTRIPLIVRWPGKTKPGSTSSSVVSTVDHYPSILAMTGQKLRPEDHKDGVNYIPALKGEAFDRGPTISDFSHYIRATMNIPNTWIRSDDWKLLRFWFDGPDQSHRDELYNLSEDIGETHNLASQHPERVQQLAAQLANYHKSTGVLKPQRNTNYNGKTVGVWSAAGKGTLSSSNGTLIMSASDSSFEATTRATPSLVKSAWIEFKACSEHESDLSVQWTSSATPAFDATKRNVTQKLSLEWKTFRVKLSFKGRISSLKFSLPSKDSVAQLRDVRLLTPDGSVITEYQFY